MPTLYLVATPIGNLEDITFRAVNILKSVHLIAAEDTRTSRILLDHYGISTPLTSYHEHNKQQKLETLLNALEAGDVALISDAGTPAISDPGYELVCGAIEAGFAVVPIAGANAAIMGLIASGLPTDQFYYVGFLPKKASARRTFLEGLRQEQTTVIAYESPHRLVDTLELIHDVLGADRPVCVARELTKTFEEFVRGTAQEVHQHFVDHAPRGEITLLIGGGVIQDDIWTEERIRAELEKRIADGQSRTSASKEIAQLSGWNKRDIYNLVDV
jgi:16S rRNA (cytidine1402-2'-O)-methyltransferase